jgi:hypothetical protein
MALGSRYYLFHDDGSMSRVPVRIMSSLPWGGALPQYAGQHLRLAAVYLRLADGNPVEVEMIQGSRLRFDADGTVDRWLRAGGIGAMETYHAERREMSQSGQVVSISARRARQRWWDSHPWEPSPSEITQMIDDIWPNEAGGRVKRAPLVRGGPKRKPPMTYESKQALSECVDYVFKLAYRLSALQDPSLKALAAEIRATPDSETAVQAALWESIAAAAEKQIAVNKAWRSPKGKWHAMATQTLWKDQSRTEGTVSMIETAECSGREEAVARCREMLSKHAHMWSDLVSIEVEVVPAIEWEHRRATVEG